MIKLELLAEDGSTLKLVEDNLHSDGLVKDLPKKVPSSNVGKFVQLKDDTAVLGASRQIVNGMVEKFDFPAVVNKQFGLKTRYPGYNGTEYDYVTLPTDYINLFYELIKWASSYKLEQGKIVGYKIHKDGGKHAIVQPKASNWWVWSEIIVDGKSHTDGPNVEQWQRADPITGRNLGNPNFAWLMRPCVNALCKIVEDRGLDWGLETLDITKPAPSLEYVLERPWLYYWANASTRTKINGRYTTDDFPMISEAFKELGLPRTGTPHLFMSKGGIAWIKKSSCIEKEPGSEWSPYYPAKG